MSKTSVNARFTMIQAFASFMDSGSQSATVIFYKGVQPANTSVAADSNNALVTLTFPEPCVKEVFKLHVLFTQPLMAHDWRAHFFNVG